MPGAPIRGRGSSRDAEASVRFLWTTFKVLVALAIAIPLAILVLAVGFGVLGALIGLAVLALKLAVVALLAYGTFRLVGAMLGGRRPASAGPTPRPLPAPDPHYEAAMRELDEALGERPRRA